MEASELKILLDLLGHPPTYRVALSQLASGGKPSDRDRAIRQLCDRGFLAWSETILRFKTAPPGKALLKLKHTEALPIGDCELELLRQAQTTSVTPGQVKLKEGDRHDILQSLLQRGLIQAETKVKELWITPDGLDYLRHTYLPEGDANLVLSPSLLSHYLRFLRQGASIVTPSAALTDEDLIATIRELDQKVGSGNYLPLFHLRRQIEPLGSRDKLDQALYRLQRQDRLLLSSVQDVSGYTPDELQAGIPQDIGGVLFFISLVEEEARSL
jgi:hypothetical protein